MCNFGEDAAVPFKLAAAALLWQNIKLHPKI